MSEPPRDFAGANLDEIFSSLGDIFGGSGQGKSKDLSIVLSLSLLEAAHGAKREVKARRGTRCTTCHGEGGAPGSKRSACKACAGAGKRSQTHGQFAIATACADCQGRGERWERTCAACEGRGDTHEDHTLDVSVPAGIATGSTLRLAGQGNDLGDGRGDLLVVIDVKAHPTLTRDGDHLRARVRFDAGRAARGGTLVVPWLEGTARVAMPAGSRANDELRLAGWGCMRLGAPYAPPPTEGAPYRTPSAARGDLIVTLVDAQSLAGAYRVLGLHLGASRKEIDAAYRRLAIRLHPERHPESDDAPAAFARVSEAYASLTSLGPAPPKEETAPTSSSRSVAVVSTLLAVAAATAYFLLR